MAENTLWGIGAIVVIVLITSIFFYGNAGPSTNIAGQAATPGVSALTVDDACSPDRFCDGSKLVLVREDCSIAHAFCQNGCSLGACR